jgi:twitching motility two-component system response regulator PilH
MSKATHIVIAEADPRLRERAAALVGSVAAELGLNVRIYEATDGEGALELCDKHHPILLITEIVLDKMSGLRLARQLRAEYGEETIIVFVTTLSREADRYWGLRNGAAAYVTKPYQDDQLRAPVRSALRGRA